jgi:Uncharacterized protein conserved in bacteria
MMTADLYDNQIVNPALDLQSFSHVLDNNDQGYKFFWFQAVLQLMTEQKRIISFEEIIDNMLANAWYMVTTYHLWLGPRRCSIEAMNKIELAVDKLNQVCSLPADASRQQIIDAIHDNDSILKEEKMILTKNVPYRFLSPFLDAHASPVWNNQAKMMELYNTLNQVKVLPYTFVQADTPLHHAIHVNADWAVYLISQYTIIHDWIIYNEVRFLQSRNPGVPGIAQKLNPVGVRKLENVKKLWKVVLTNTSVPDIYTDQLINQEHYDIDHFVPWSFVASDELWNLIPAEKSLNCSKSNKLPNWDEYSDKFADKQYLLYQQIFTFPDIKHEFTKCYKDNLNNQWAVEQLYIPNHSYQEFHSILMENLKPIYDAAKDQGFEVWQSQHN